MRSSPARTTRRRARCGVEQIPRTTQGIAGPASGAGQQLATDHPLAGRTRLSLDDLTRHRRVRVLAVSAQDKPAERLLTNLGVHSPTALTVPYFAAAAAAVPRTTLIAVLPGLFAQRHSERHPETRIVPGPPEFTPFEYGMTWHPRLNGDPAHQWVRSQLDQAARSVVEAT
jgi:DNA-binding transcriptional LysR family regulator